MNKIFDDDLMIVKRDGSIVPFNKTKIRKAVISAMRDGGVYLPDIARIIANDAENYFLKSDSIPTISQVEEYVFYPCLIVSDKDKTQLNDVIQQATKYIDEKNKSKSIRDENTLIYIKEK